MKKIISNNLLFLGVFFATTAIFGQNTTISAVDKSLQNRLYIPFKNDVHSYSILDYDALFFVFLKNFTHNSTNSSKEQYATFTTKNANYSKKQALLSKNKKEATRSTTAKWFLKNYSDYFANQKLKN